MTEQTVVPQCYQEPLARCLESCAPRQRTAGREDEKREWGCNRLFACLNDPENSLVDWRDDLLRASSLAYLMAESVDYVGWKSATVRAPQRDLRQRADRRRREPCELDVRLTWPELVLVGKEALAATDLNSSFLKAEELELRGYVAQLLALDCIGPVVIRSRHYEQHKLGLSERERGSFEGLLNAHRQDQSKNAAEVRTSELVLTLQEVSQVALGLREALRCCDRARCWRINRRLAQRGIT